MINVKPKVRGEGWVKIGKEVLWEVEEEVWVKIGREVWREVRGKVEWKVRDKIDG